MLGAMAHRAPACLPIDLCTRLETARLDLLALFRALDRMDLSPAEIPQRLLRQLFERDADYAEALWALDQPPGIMDLHAVMGHDLSLRASQANFRLITQIPLRPDRRTLAASAWGWDRILLRVGTAGIPRRETLFGAPGKSGRAVFAF